MIKTVMTFICIVVSLQAFEYEDYKNIYNAVKYKELEVLKKISPEDSVESLVYAVRYGHLDVVKALIKLGTNVNAYNDRDTSALYEAFRSERFDIVNYLIEHGAILNIKTDYSNDLRKIEPYLFKAIDDSNIRLVKNLLRYGIDKNVKNHKNQTPLEYAIERKKISISEYLKKLMHKYSRNNSSNEKNDFYGKRVIYSATGIQFTRA